MKANKNTITSEIIKDLITNSSVYKEDDKEVLRILNRTIRELREKNEELEKQRDEAMRNEDKIIDEYNELVEEFNANVEDYNKLDDEVEDLLTKIDMKDEIIDGLTDMIEEYEEKLEDFNFKTTILFEVKHDRKQAQIIDDLNLLIDIKDNEIDELEDELEETHKKLATSNNNLNMLKGYLKGLGYVIMG